MAMRNGFLTWARSGLVCFFVGMFLLSVCFSAADVVAAESGGKRIDSIDVGGNRNVSKAKVLATVRAKVGEIFDKKSAEEDAGRLAKIEGVEYAYYNIETLDGAIKLTYVIVEKNVVRSIVFIGNEKIKRGKLFISAAHSYRTDMAESGNRMSPITNTWEFMAIAVISLCTMLTYSQPLCS